VLFRSDSMLGKTVRLEGDNGRWVAFTVEVEGATAQVGHEGIAGESFPFSLENFGYVLKGLGYQAWGGGSHFTFRRTGEGFALEFQAAGDRCPAIRHLKKEELAKLIHELAPLSPRIVRATVL